MRHTCCPHSWSQLIFPATTQHTRGGFHNPRFADGENFREFLACAPPGPFFPASLPCFLSQRNQRKGGSEAGILLPPAPHCGPPRLCDLIGGCSSCQVNGPVRMAVLNPGKVSFTGLGLCPVRSPLLGVSRLITLPRAT